jgi:hypothetical protein
LREPIRQALKEQWGWGITALKKQHRVEPPWVRSLPCQEGAITVTGIFNAYDRNPGVSAAYAHQPLRPQWSLACSRYRMIACQLFASSIGIRIWLR